MTRTTQERETIAKDIEEGLIQMHAQLKGWHKVMPLAIEELQPGATSTRKLLKANTLLVELGLEIQNAVKFGIKVKESK